MNRHIARLRVLRQVRSGVKVREPFTCALAIAEGMVEQNDGGLFLSQHGLEELSWLAKEFPQIPDVYLRSGGGPADKGGMKNNNTTLAHDLAKYMTADEKAQMIAILDNVADRSAKHAEESKSNVDARVRRERTSRVQAISNLLTFL